MRLYFPSGLIAVWAVYVLADCDWPLQPLFALLLVAALAYATRELWHRYRGFRSG